MAGRGFVFCCIPGVKRWFIAAVLVLLAGCDTPPSQLRQVTIESPEALGLSLREVPDSALRSMGLAYGLTVVKAGSLAERSGLRLGDVVYGVNEKRLRTIEDFTRIVAEQPGGSLGLLVRRGGSDVYVPMDLGAVAPRRRDGLPNIAPPSKDTLLRT
jgi:membrane-associated protease RseP (regulator of RpoE activity)